MFFVAQNSHTIYPKETKTLIVESLQIKPMLELLVISYLEESIRIFIRMEKLKQSPFLTVPALADKQNKQRSSQINGLRTQIKQMVQQMPDPEIVRQVLANLGFSSAVLEAARKVEEKEQLGPDQLKKIMYQLKVIHKETKRMRPLKNVLSQEAQKFDSPPAPKYTLLNKIYNRGQKENTSRDNIENIFIKQVDEQMRRRKYMEAHKENKHIKNRENELAKKSNAAKQFNKKVEKAYKAMIQKENQHFQTLAGKMRSQIPQDYSIWNKGHVRMAKTSETKQRQKFTLKSQTSAFMNEQFDLRENSVWQSDLNSTLKPHKTFRAHRILRNNHQSEQKLAAVLQNKRQAEQKQFQNAVQNAMNKELFLKELRQKKQAAKRLKKFTITKQNKNHSPKAQSRASSLSSRKILEAIEEKLSKKHQILQGISEHTRQELRRRHEDFYRRKMYIVQQKDEKIEKYREQLNSEQKKSENKKSNEDLRVQKIIKQRLDISLRKKHLSERLLKIKKCPQSHLEKQLSTLSRQEGLANMRT